MTPSTLPPLPGVPAASRAALQEILDRTDPAILGVVLSGSAARGMATERSDVDVYVVRTEEAGTGLETSRSPAVDEIPTTLAEIEAPGALGTDDWWYRWSFAHAHVLRDDTGGRLTEAVRRHAELAGEEQRAVLVDRLDGYVNFAFRALKAERDGRPLELRLDAAESVTWWLDTVYALRGRVRPYNKYLPWALREHPLGVPEWSADVLLPLLERILDGDPGALRTAYAPVERECLAWDRAHGGTDLADTLAGWGDQLDLLR
ncbi:nucleotidyltransferase domain-containing protein [Nocardioides sp. KIGAM211]|uniref:Nucleotidyltransferase domain-containing protein n=1 Tax=Nocardioides luti TaxID=2761101 RepID=A0A7X0RJS3_9ACTN|nr:nucleotidyltransferase domain-containing protein [Nocardioides luti]